MMTIQYNVPRTRGDEPINREGQYRTALRSPHTRG